MTRAASLSSNLSLSRPVDGLSLPQHLSRRNFYRVLGLAFFLSATATVIWCNSMPAMPEMPMPGGWTMSMTWMRMPGETWLGATASFVAMWSLMMMAMMLPSLAPMLWRYYQAIRGGGAARPSRPTTLVGAGYFFVWALFGLGVFPVGVTLAALEMQYPALARVVPLGGGLLVLLAGAVQFTPWKVHHLARCRTAPGGDCTIFSRPSEAWKLGLHFGMHCGLSCANLTAVLLVLGVMDLRAMAVVTIAITTERLVPVGAKNARAVGSVAMGTGLLLVARALLA